MPRGDGHPGSRASAWLLAALVVALPLARGGFHSKAQAAALLVAGLAALLAARKDSRLTWPGLGLLGVLLLIALQTTPLPPSLLAHLHGQAGIFDSVLRPMGLFPAWRPVTLDAPATWSALGGAALWWLAFTAAWLNGGGRARRAALVAALAMTGIAAALTVLLGALLRLTPLLAPELPFLNPNHLAGLLVLSAPVSLGLALQTAGGARLLWLLGFMVSSVGVFLSLSRAGMTAYVLSLMVFGAVRTVRGSRQRGTSGRRLAVVLATGLTFAVSAFLALGPVVSEVRTLRTVTEENKIALWRPALAMLGDFPLTGIGRGAFMSAFPAYKLGSEQVTYTHLENEWLQAGVELGVPGALLYIAALGVTWIVALTSARSPVSVGLLSGTAALAAHNVFDFSLQSPGIGIAFVVALALAARDSRPVPIARWLGIALVVVATAAGGFGLWSARRQGAQASMEQVLVAPTAADGVALARSAVALRPVDYALHVAAAARLLAEGRCGAAMPWLLRSMLLNPTAPEAHLYAGRCLTAANQPAEALREYRLALAFGRADALMEAAVAFPDVESLQRVVPDTPDGLMVLGSLLERDRPDDAAQVYRRVIDLYGDPRARVALAMALRRIGQLEEALGLARDRTVAAPNDAAAWRVLAEILLDSGAESEAVEAAKTGLQHRPGSRELLVFLFDRAMSHRQFSEARRFADDISAKTPADVAWRLQLAARALAAQGRLPEAVDLTRSAASLQPGAAAPLLNLSRYLEQMGRYHEATDALERAASSDAGETEMIERQRAHLREAASAARARRETPRVR